MMLNYGYASFGVSGGAYKPGLLPSTDACSATNAFNLADDMVESSVLSSICWRGKDRMTEQSRRRPDSRRPSRIGRRAATLCRARQRKSYCCLRPREWRRRWCGRWRLNPDLLELALSP